MKRTLYLSFVVLWLLCGCEPSNLYLEGTNYSDATQISQGVVTLNESENQLNLLEVTANNIQNKVLFSPQNGELVYQFFPGKEGNTSSSLYVVTYPATKRQTDRYPTLNVVDPDSKKVIRYNTGSLFGAHQFDPAGKYMILYHDDLDSDIIGGLHNPNEIAIVDLQSPPSATNPNIQSIDIAGHTIDSIHFFEEIFIGATQRKLVAFATRGAIQFTDFNHPAFPRITVALKTDDDQRVIVPTNFKLLPAENENGPRLFVQAKGATEIFDIEFKPKNNDVGFYATTALLDGGDVPSDFALVKDEGELFVVSASSSSRQLNIFRASTAHITSISLGDQVDTIIERTQNGNRELVMFGNNSQNIYFLPFEKLAEELGDSVESINVPSGIQTAYALDNDRFLIHPFNGYGIVIADLRTRTLTNLSGANSSSWSSGILWNNTFFLNEYSEVSYLDIITGSPGTLALDERISEFYVFEKQGVGVAMHPAITGRATLFPLQVPTRAASSVIDGFFVSGVLNEGEE